MPKSLPPDMIVRRAVPTDIPSLADLFVSAPGDGELYQYPDFANHLDEMPKQHVKWLCQVICDPTMSIRVAVIPEPEKQDRIVGFSGWKKMEFDQEYGDVRAVELVDVAWSHADEEVLADLASQLDSGPSHELQPDPARKEAISRCRKTATLPPPSLSTTRYELCGLAVHNEYQGHGIGSELVQWGLDRATEERIPVFVGGEERGIGFYEGALGFRRLKSTEYWLDGEGRDIAREEVDAGNRDWERERGGVSGADAVWLPESVDEGLADALRGYM
ncbi:acyl- n-acyltransferase [Trichoderma arundinaceum]|uniref:Acyl-n-acyltransferase n=1 Tax=Trichoderma arundinaceum TaxID=490622 RepID=A0A395NHV2_TRIAR|nr:acyl- n-acyltransferase [Trichoderma arundinaceum]